MASSKEYLGFVLDQLSSLDDISYRPMMGEYIIYFEGKIVGGIYDDRFLVKQTKASRAMLPGAPLEPPYEGAKEMILVDRIDDAGFLCALLCAMVGELPAPKK
ncbi:MAG: TfoX/Sxy family protein [Clostridia bacterium]|nr:TfoX/Sxy family protein [Clostridia bacterium]